MELDALYAAHVATLTDRVSLALERAGYDRVVIHAGDLVLRSRFDDLEWPFRPTPAFCHWASWPWPGSAVVLEKGRAARLLARRRSDFWERPEARDADLVRRGIDVTEVESSAELRSAAERPRSAFIGETKEAGIRLGFEEPDINPPALVELLHETRVHKTPYEVASLAEANRRAARGHRAVAAAFLEGERSELGLHLLHLGVIGEDQPPYGNIVALGDAAAVLHHHDYRDRPEARSLLLDAGAGARGYAADITRTHVAPGDDSGFAELVASMDALQQAVIARIEVGIGYESLHDQAHDLLGGLLVEHGLVTCSAEAAVHQGLTRVFFPHGLGHSLGVQVHDVGCRRTPPRKENAWLRNTRTIETGQVFTIEPGLYFIDALLEPLRSEPLGESVRWDRIERLRGYGGIRIEDDVLVLDGSAKGRVRNLSREAFVAADAD